MNIFVLDKTPEGSASYHCDKHVVKMILESGQMLCTSHWTLGLEGLGKHLKDFKRVRDAKHYILEKMSPALIPPWSMSHVRHPCTIWTSSSAENYRWHLRLMRALLDEYTLRYNRKHKAEQTYEWLAQAPPSNIPDIGLTQHPQCMPDECKVENNPVEGYRNYYKKYKSYMARWKLGNIPVWWEEAKDV